MSERVCRNYSEMCESVRGHIFSPNSTEKILHAKNVNVPQTVLKALVSLFPSCGGIIRTLSTGKLARLCL